jgi:hypothetical protein
MPCRSPRPVILKESANAPQCLDFSVHGSCLRRLLGDGSIDAVPASRRCQSAVPRRAAYSGKPGHVGSPERDGILCLGGSERCSGRVQRAQQERASSHRQETRRCERPKKLNGSGSPDSGPISRNARQVAKNRFAGRVGHGCEPRRQAEQRELEIPTRSVAARSSRAWAFRFAAIGPAHVSANLDRILADLVTAAPLSLGPNSTAIIFDRNAMQRDDSANWHGRTGSATSEFD